WTCRIDVPAQNPSVPGQEEVVGPAGEGEDQAGGNGSWRAAFLVPAGQGRHAGLPEIDRPAGGTPNDSVLELEEQALPLALGDPPRGLPQPHGEGVDEQSLK